MVARARREPNRPERSADRDAAAPEPVSRGPQLLDYLAPAGNRAVGRFVRSLQRAPDYTQTVQDVEKTGITRLEVRGLKYGVDDFWTKYGDDPDDASDERNLTSESPKHMAVVLMPDKL